MKQFKVVIFICILLLEPKQLSAQKKINHNISKSITKDIVNNIDSAFIYNEYREHNHNFKGIRVIDTKHRLSMSKGWNILSGNIKYVIIDKFPYDVNTKDYNDIIMIDFVKKKDTLTIKALCMLYKSCDFIPVYIETEYKVGRSSLRKLRMDIIVLGDWNPFR